MTVKMVHFTLGNPCLLAKPMHFDRLSPLLADPFLIFLLRQSYSVSSIIFAFVHCWELSLFLVAVLPVIIYTGFLLMRSYGLRAKINNASYEKASGIAEQVKINLFLGFFSNQNC